MEQTGRYFLEEVTLPGWGGTSWRRWYFLEEVTLPGGGDTSWRKLYFLEEMTLPGGGGTSWRKWYFLEEMALPGGNGTSWRRWHFLEEMTLPGGDGTSWRRWHFLEACRRSSLDLGHGVVDGLGHVVDVLGGQAAHVDAAARHQVHVLLFDHELHLFGWRHTTRRRRRRRRFTQSRRPLYTLAG